MIAIYMGIRFWLFDFHRLHQYHYRLHHQRHNYRDDEACRYGISPSSSFLHVSTSLMLFLAIYFEKLCNRKRHSDSRFRFWDRTQNVNISVFKANSSTSCYLEATVHRTRSWFSIGDEFTTWTWTRSSETRSWYRDIVCNPAILSRQSARAFKNREGFMDGGRMGKRMRSASQPSLLPGSYSRRIVLDIELTLSHNYSLNYIILFTSFQHSHKLPFSSDTLDDHRTEKRFYSFFRVLSSRPKWSWT